MTPQETALPVVPTVIPAGAEVGQDGYLGHDVFTIPAAKKST